MVPRSRTTCVGVTVSARLRHLGRRLYERTAGRSVMRALEDLLETQWLNRDELHALQRQRLLVLVEYANRYVPHYQRLFRQIGFEPGDLRKDPESFRHLPTVEKSFIRDHSGAFLTTDPARHRRLQARSTSGSTGHPLIFWEDRDSLDHQRAGLLRHLTWGGWAFGDTHAFLWGRPLEEPFRMRVRNGLMDFVMDRFASDAYVLSERSMHDLARQIQRRRPKLIFGYPSSLAHFARFVEEKGQDNVKLPAVFTSAEVLYPHQREVIERVFDCKVFNRYAALETGDLACECEAHIGATHMSSESCVIEILNGENPAQPGEPGQVVITNLNNFGFPFIRYRLGDIARVSRQDGCPCGRQHPLLETVEGRQVDMFQTEDGRVVFGDFQSTLFEVDGLRQFQIVQKSVNLVLIRLVTSETFRRSQLDVIERAAKRVMGSETKVTFEFLDSIPTGSLGKFRYAISEVSGSG